jgi:hypothetical protein
LANIANILSTQLVGFGGVSDLLLDPRLQILAHFLGSFWGEFWEVCGCLPAP